MMSHGNLGRRMSATTRRNMRKAQQARWAKKRALDAGMPWDGDEHTTASYPKHRDHRDDDFSHEKTVNALTEDNARLRFRVRALETKIADILLADIEA